MLGIAVRSAGMEGLLDHVISVDAVRKYKTHPEAYALGEQATGLKAANILFVSSNSWDALGATWYGYRTLWVNRYQHAVRRARHPTDAHRRQPARRPRLFLKS